MSNLSNFTGRISRPIMRLGLKVRAKSPTILLVTGLGSIAAGVAMAVTTAYTLKPELEPVLDDIRDEKSPHRKAALTEAAKIIGIRFWKPLSAMALGTACIIKGHTILTGRNAALMVAYAGLQGVFDKYRDQVKEAIGEEKEARYYLESQGSERVDDGSDPAVIRMATASPYAKWFDESSKEWHRNHDYNLMTLHTVQNYMNDLLRLRGHVFLNEVYDRLGLPRTKAGCVVGWVYNRDDNAGDNLIDFGYLTATDQESREVINGYSKAILLDFNVDGMIWDLI